MTSFGIIHHFAGATTEQYDAVVAAVHPADGSLPPGQTHHVAGATDDGLVVVALWDSPESWETFRDETLMPGMQKVGDAGPPSPPQETTFKIHNKQSA